MRRFLYAVAAAVIAIAAMQPASAAPLDSRRDPTDSPKKQGRGNGVYIVQLIENPVVAYGGTVPGYKATKPKRGQKIDPNDPAVRAYGDFLTSRHDAVLQSAGGGRKLYSYKYTYNGFAAQITDAQASQLAADPGVVAVTKDERQQLDTSRTPQFLGLNALNGLWSQLSGNVDGNPIIDRGPNSGGAGEGVIVGIIDSGIWPENPSFTDRDATGKLVFQQIPGWHGKCTPGEQFPASNCNQKIIGAQWFNQGFGGDALTKQYFSYEFMSARGADGHGSHTAGTAAGNYNVPAIVDGNNLGLISGMAPRARIAVYKTCWGIPPEGGCFNSDNVAAIDQAVADGVDVINFSISGSTTSFVDPVEIAFLFAADAGVFVAASAGNSGPTASTVAHNSPWLTTVAAGTLDRQYAATVTVGNGTVYNGVGLGSAVSSSPLILSTDAALPGANATAVRLCYSTAFNGAPVLDPAKIAGKIVLCDRGANARIDKSQAVLEAGGVGMILANTNVNSLNADLHYVPTVHVDNVVGAQIKAYIAGAGATATASLSQGLPLLAVAPDVAAFSSRGPARAGGGDLLKPDIMAPGVDIIAAMSPIEAGRNFDFLSGTSMSSPHIAGIAALFKQKYPTWSPAMIKSALMTTASQTRNNGSLIAGGPFEFGAGEVTPNSAADPGLVYDAGWINWLGFLCGVGQLNASYCPSIKIDPSSLNYPSIAIGDLAGTQTVTRSVTNVSGKSLTVNASISGLAGVNAVVSPATLTLAKGETKSFVVTFTTAGAALTSYTDGALTWTGGGYNVRSPIVIRPVALAAPAQVAGTGAAVSYSVSFGYNGPFSAQARGLVPASVTPGTVADDPTDSTCSLSSPNAQLIPVSVPAGTTYARFSLFDADVNAGSDIDLCVFRGTTLVGSSGTGTSAEEVNLLNPAADTYTVVVQGWGVVGSTPFKLYAWVLGSTDAGNMTVSAPANATVGSAGTVNLSFSGLSAGTKYLGSVAYSGSTNMPNPTIVRVDMP